jgi:hypothetical protein
VIYRTGAAGAWIADSTPTLPFAYGATYPQWNNPNGGGAGVWGLTELTSGDFVNYYLIAVPSVNTATQLLLVPGQALYGTLAAALGASISEIAWGDVPFEEAAPLYRLTYRAFVAYGGSRKAQLQSVTAITAGGASVTQASAIHNSLSSRDAADAHPASSITFTPYSTLTSTNVQAALQELLDELNTFQRGGAFLSPGGALAVVIWRAPYACTVLNVRGFRLGGTGATINARKNGASTHLSSDLSLSSGGSWMDGGAVQNETYAAGDYLELLLQSVSGSPTQVVVQVDFRRA